VQGKTGSGDLDTKNNRLIEADFKKWSRCNDRLVKLRVNVTLGGLVAAVASEHNYDAFVDAFLKDMTILHIDQADESDLLFLT